MMSDATDQPEDEGLHESLGTVGESMTVAVVTLRPDMRTPDAVAMLRNHGVGGAPVVEAGRLVGIATVSDLLALAPRAHATGPFLRPLRNRPEWCVRDVMSESVFVAGSEERPSSKRSSRWTTVGWTACPSSMLMDDRWGSWPERMSFAPSRGSVAASASVQTSGDRSSLRIERQSTGVLSTDRSVEATDHRSVWRRRPSRGWVGFRQAPGPDRATRSKGF
jgi:CBS domain